jgi:hypothetical protein
VDNKVGKKVELNKCLPSQVNCFGTKITRMIHFLFGNIRKSPGTPVAKIWLSEMPGVDLRGPMQR